jgi:hypothetical protein
LDSIPKKLPFYWIQFQNIGKMNKNCNSEGRLESVRYGEGTIKIQEIVAILKITQIGEYVPLVVEGGGEDKLLQLVMPIF